MCLSLFFQHFCNLKLRIGIVKKFIFSKFDRIFFSNYKSQIVYKFYSLEVIQGFKNSNLREITFFYRKF